MKSQLINPMKKIKYLLLLLGVAVAVFTSCDNDPEPLVPGTSYDNGVLIVNEGNFFSADGEITHYDPVAEEVTNNLYQTVNGVILAAYVEQVGVFGETAYIVDSNQGAAKVVAVDKASFKEKGRVEGLEIPRDVAVVENKLFIADWGDYDDEGNYTNPNSFVAVAGIGGGDITDRIIVSSRPQSIVGFDGNVFVACESSREIIKINPTSLEIEGRTTLSLTPSEFLIQEGRLLLFGADEQQIHLAEINPANLDLSEVIYPIANATRLVLGEAGEAYALTTAYSSDYSYTENKVLRFPLSGSGAGETIYEARNLKGIGWNRAADQVFIADDNGIQGNGTVIITDRNGEEIKKLDVGRVPSRFYFY